MKSRLFQIMALAGAIAMPTAAMAQDAPAEENTPVVVPDSPVAANDTVSADNAAAEETIVDLKVDEPKAKDDDKKDSDDDDDKGWGVGATIGFDLGLGAFTKDSHARKTRSTFTMQINGFYTIPVIDVDIHLDTGFTQWLSKAGGTNSKYEFRWADSTVGFSRPLWEYDNKNGFGVNFGIDLSFILPTSTATINEKRYIVVAPSLSAGIRFHRLSLSYAITYAYNAHKYTSLTFDPDEVDVISRSAGNELINSGNIAIGGVLVEHGLVNQLALNIECIKKMLNLNIALGFLDEWTYDNGTITEDDEFVNQNAKVGRGHRQVTQGNISLLYTPIKYATVAFSVISTQPSKSADNKTIRFPWFDTISPSKNYTKFMISGIFRY